MTTIRWLSPQDSPDSLPAPETALHEPNGLLAAGGSLSPDWLLASYARGIFPWFEEGQPILWWSPDPRAVLLPRELHVSRSLTRTLRRGSITVTCDQAFDAVISACAAPRRYTNQTWITADMRSAYTHLHALGYAHSFESWIDGELVAGLYGIAIGRVFFGESMFTKVTDASKVAFVQCTRFLDARGCELIDCQLPSQHLASLGARNIPRDEFLARLDSLTADADQPGSWDAAFAAAAPDTDLG